MHSDISDDILTSGYMSINVIMLIVTEVEEQVQQIWQLPKQKHDSLNRYLCKIIALLE